MEENTVLILGATSDIARAISHLYAKEGLRIHLAGRNADALGREANDLRIRYQAEVYTSHFDALEEEKHEAFYNQLDPKPSTVICVFGHMTDQEEAETDWHAARKMLMVNYTGAVSILEIAARHLSEAGSGCIVGISSVAGDRGRASNYFYGSAKAGFTAYLSGLRNRLHKHGIHVMTVKPGFVRTRMTEGMDLPGPLTAEPEEVARAILRAVKKKKNVLYTKGIWRIIMLIIRHIPESIFKRLSL